MNKKTVENKQTEDILILNGKRYPVTIRDVPQHELGFYLENPRLYSIVRVGGKEPTEDEILEQLLGMDHVKRLIQSISDHGGLIDPVVVHGKSLVVLEGNSRLAAYRHLAGKDAVKWGKIRAKILPADIEEGDIFALLGEYHIHGKKDWAPFEQAGYLYRRQAKHNIPIPDLAKEIKLPKGEVTHLIEVYAFMVEHQETDPERWSYYDEFLKGRKIAKLRTDYGASIDQLIVKKVRSKEIPTAMALRDGLKAICRSGGKSMHRFAEGKLRFEAAVQAAEDRGASESCLQRVERFRKWLAENDAEADLLDLSVELKNRCQYELKQIIKRCEQLTKKLDASK